MRWQAAALWAGVLGFLDFLRRLFLPSRYVSSPIVR